MHTVFYALNASQSTHKVAFAAATNTTPTYLGTTAYLPDEQTPVAFQAADELVPLAMEHFTEPSPNVAVMGANTN